MAYSSYNEYIVIKNGGVIFGLAVANFIVFNYNIKLLLYIFDAAIFKAFEFLISLICLYNLWGIVKGFVLPYIKKAKIPYSEYLFTPGPATLALWNLLCFLFIEVLLVSSTPTGTSYLAEAYIRKVKLGNPATRKETSTANALNYFLTEDATASKLAAYSNPNDSFAGTVPKLRFKSCIKPPLEPSAHRARTLWYLNRTPEVVDDFRIEQILAFRKNWNKFNDRLSSIYYDKMINELYERIFKPLAKSIDNFTAVLATRQQTIAKCPPATIALSLVIPGFNSNSEFTISEVVHFITLEGYASEEAKQYVVDRIFELSRSNKLAAYRFTPKSVGMPKDAEIIMHVLSVYLDIKEPKAIPPLVPSDADLFKFLLVYFYITPELDHWKIFK
ncbi:hypothetical protein BDF21DRAFT_191550 [Thamnidium elegans]|nr:hypothetical protein BDF21DRAFT_191550 [Thamnidium elegans]